MRLIASVALRLVTSVGPVRADRPCRRRPPALSPQLSLTGKRHADRHAQTEKRHAGVMATSQSASWRRHIVDCRACAEPRRRRAASRSSRPGRDRYAVRDRQRGFAVDSTRLRSAAHRVRISSTPGWNQQHTGLRSAAHRVRSAAPGCDQPRPVAVGSTALRRAAYRGPVGRIPRCATSVRAVAPGAAGSTELLWAAPRCRAQH
jgi:hypothetical protein